MQHLHTEEQEQTSMDATSTIRATVCAAAMIITLQSCTTEQPQPPSQSLEPIEFSGYDMTDNAGKALQDLEVFLNSVTTTSTTIPKHTQNSSSNTSGTAKMIDPADRNVWDELAQCESGGNWSANTGNGYGGGLQFAHTARWSTWNSYGGNQYTSHPWEASREQQIDIAEQVLQSSGWGAWPGCARKLGLR
jgi:hypothetical protein